ncbi:MAG: 16S rRNA (cytosine(1402)-N(4))-methyltransferase [Candidatus Magasanikbacteria bacterium CG10_big_fil_rev_8_21_14_0_10_43_6]|uniref:Ribosomal RNA small subunit methyltransferase H n=1 Tax=Candidatus Magasanikbacteria bacterium CG10_big_fil_rev_8_21_14_0_10_43_6 TaxID=1974650 RepID=A0A2M6VZY0_9BACT|nr:MAG: 16S rRNA (cytosine(1402)-N(4))-methyltransferase [Candidatus Magasanikbacteria bacterium CG10_big_fil_rev_8_21_14_0_10_43_6]
MNRHIPVLLNETLLSLNLAPGKQIVDGTLGDAGHAEKILAAISPHGKLMGIDADAEAILRAKQFLHKYEGQTIFVRDNFEHLKEIIAREAFGPVDGMLLDLGWSTPQFEERRRGFSFQQRDEVLDMRYDTLLQCPHTEEDPPLSVDGKPLYGKCTAAELLHIASEEMLRGFFERYGEEQLSKEIAAAIVEQREGYPIETVGDLVDIILVVYRKKLRTEKEVPWVGGLHPATKVFQALRIAVNDELGVVERVLPDAIDVLAPGGRLSIITFHSLEDRIVKHFFKKEAEKKTIRLVHKKPITCSKEEHAANPHARSAKLRTIEKI